MIKNLFFSLLMMTILTPPAQSSRPSVTNSHRANSHRTEGQSTDNQRTGTHKTDNVVSTEADQTDARNAGNQHNHKPQTTNHEPQTTNNKRSNASDTLTTDVSLGEVIVSSLRMDRQVRMVPTPMAVAGTFDFRKHSALSLSHVLQREPGIAMSSDGIWSTGLNIRGMDESRLVVLVDGNRVETATDLTASLSMIDINDIQRVEVIRGAQSSLYGTGAMGGIVNIITRDGHFAPRPYLKGTASTGYASGNLRVGGYGALDTGAERWFLRLSGSYTSAGNMRTPEGTLPNSQFTTNNINAKAGFKPWENHQLKVQLQRNRNSDVGIPGGTAFPGLAEATYTDINRDLLNIGYAVSDLTGKLTSLEMNIFRQYILRDVALKPNTMTEANLPNGNRQRTTPELFTPTGEHLTHGARLQSNWELSPQNSLIAGVDLWGRKLTTSREKFIRVDVLNPAGDIIKTNQLERGETPIPESHFSSGGLFFQDEIRWLNGQLTLITGGRIDRVWISNEAGYDVDYLVLNGERNDAPPTKRLTYPAGSEQSFSWSANTGLLWKLRNDVDVAMNLARSFRAPSLEERFKYIDLGNLVLLGDPALDPEQGYSADIGLRIWKPGITLQTELFVNALRNMIVEVPGEFIFRLTDATAPDTLPALIYDNVSSALLYGFNAGIDMKVWKHLVTFASVGYVRGANTKTDEELPRIPPLKGRAGVRYTLPTMGTAEMAVTAAAQQDQIAPGEVATDGYYCLDLAIYSRRFMFHKLGVQLFAGIDNITDRSYTNHLATNRGGISVEPGRNIFTRLVVDF